MCRDDLVNLYIQALTDEAFSGVYNATAPNPVRMSELCSSLGSQLGRPSWLPVPDFALQVCFPTPAFYPLDRFVNLHTVPSIVFLFNAQHWKSIVFLGWHSHV